jgi:hypothetical protein
MSGHPLLDNTTTGFASSLGLKTGSVAKIFFIAVKCNNEFLRNFKLLDQINRGRIDSV